MSLLVRLCSLFCASAALEAEGSLSHGRIRPDFMTYCGLELPQACSFEQIVK